MTAVPVAQRMTADEFLALPEPHDGRRHELVEGELVVTFPGFLHGAVQAHLVFTLGKWARAQSGRGIVTLTHGISLDDRNLFGPDILWYREGRAPGRHDPPPYSMPDLAVEVRSASTWRYDIGAKKAAYERHGLPELWLVDTAAAEVLVFRRSAPQGHTFDVALELGRGDTLASPLLPGFALAIGELYPAE